MGQRALLETPSQIDFIAVSRGLVLDITEDNAPFEAICSNHTQIGLTIAQIYPPEKSCSRDWRGLL